MTTVSDWMRLNCGDRVHEIDGRHTGTVKAILHGSYARVVWDDTGWISDIALEDIVCIGRRS